VAVVVIIIVVIVVVVVVVVVVVGNSPHRWSRDSEISSSIIWGSSGPPC